ncbi:MAG: flagellar hook-length control protein FliK [Rubrivivax sp.]|nr:flagellar hook-length control protein FliK [Rubrivivax sp.]
MPTSLMPPVAAPPALPAAPAPAPGQGPPEAAAPQAFARLLNEAHAASAPDEGVQGGPPGCKAGGTVTDAKAGAAPAAADADTAPATDGGATLANAEADPRTAAEIAAEAAAAGAAAPDAAALLASLAAAPRPHPLPLADATAGTGRELTAGLGRNAARGPALTESRTGPDGAAAKTTTARADAAHPGDPPMAVDPLATHPTSRAAQTAAAGAGDSPAWREELQAATRELAVTQATASPAGAAPALAAAPAPGAAPAPAAPAPTPATSTLLTARPGSAEFGPQLGTQITTFVRDGVQHARLELNPAEMGPVTVRIELDGATAKVHLMAEHAQTRQALEQAMPLLAGSLREAGMTLGGGGVFEQPRQPQPGGTGAPAPTPGDADDGAQALLTPAPAAALRRRGVVDLVA